MNRVASAFVTGAGVLVGGFLGGVAAKELHPKTSETGMLIGGLIGGMIAGAATAEPAAKQTGVGQPPHFEPRFP